jgi:hypothetical protein
VLAILLIQASGQQLCLLFDMIAVCVSHPESGSPARMMLIAGILVTDSEYSADPASEIP